MSTLAWGGVRTVDMALGGGVHLEWLPPELAHLTSLALCGDYFRDGWEHLSHQLRQLRLTYGSRYASEQRSVPLELAGLTQLSSLSLAASNHITGGWQHLPRQLQQLILRGRGLQQLPAALTALEQLTELAPDSNPIKGGWQHLPRQLQQITISDCSLEQLAVELAALAQLSYLNLYGSVIRGGWQHLPQQLQCLHLTCSRCQPSWPS